MPRGHLMPQLSCSFGCYLFSVLVARAANINTVVHLWSDACRVIGKPQLAAATQMRKMLCSKRYLLQ